MFWQGLGTWPTDWKALARANEKIVGKRRVVRMIMLYLWGHVNYLVIALFSLFLASMLCQQCYSREHKEALYLLLNNVLSTLFIAKVKDILARPCRLMKKIIIPKVLGIINLTKREGQMKCPIKKCLRRIIPKKIHEKRWEN